MKKLISILTCLCLISSGMISVADTKASKTENDFIKLIKEQDKKVNDEYLNSLLGSNTSDIIIMSIPGDSGNPPSINSTTTINSMGVMDYGSQATPGAYTNVSGSLSQKKIYLKAYADPLWSDASAWGYIGRDFIYSGTSNKAANLRVTGDFRVSLATIMTPIILSDSGSSAKINIEVWDKTTGSRLATRNVLDQSLSSSLPVFKTFSSSYNETISVTLVPNHKYIIVVRGDLSATARVTGSGRSIAHPDDNGYIGIGSITITL